MHAIFLLDNLARVQDIWSRQENRLMNAIKNYMKENKLSAYKLARMVGVDPSTVYRQLNGEVSISIETARKYSEKLDIPLTEILEISVRNGQPQ